MIAKYFLRPTRPVLSAVAEAVAPLLAVNQAGGFYPRWTGVAVQIEYGDWTGVDEEAVAAAVLAAPDYDTVVAAQSAEFAAALSMELPTFAEIDTLVDTLFAGLTAGQRTYLKRLSKIVRVLCALAKLDRAVPSAELVSPKSVRLTRPVKKPVKPKAKRR